jgi:alpha-L-fucosidase
VGGNGEFLLNIPPDRRGLFQENDVTRLRELGNVLKTSFLHNLATGAVLAAQVDEGHSVGEMKSLLDGDSDTFLTTSDSPTAVVLTAEFPAPVRANCLMLQEHIASGQRVERLTWKCLLTATGTSGQ